MSDQTPVDEAIEMEIDELALLKSRARLMGITFSNNISLETLKRKVAEHLEAQAEPVAESAPVVMQAPVKTKTLRQFLYEEQMKLVRVRVTCLDPKKKDLPGEFFTVANDYLGTVRKYVPYGAATDNGYHIPLCIYNMMKAREFLSITVRKISGSEKTVVDQRMVPEFALEVLPPLTHEELKKLAAAQAAANGLD